MIYFVGDVHALFDKLVTKMTHYNIENSYLIQVGDFGAGFKRDEENLLETINRFLIKNGNRLYVVRGNHDNPSYFRKTKDIGNISFLPDYSILNIEDKTILLIGGAVSIDRTERIEGNSYWKDEGFKFEKDLLDMVTDRLSGIDIVVTHTAPSEFWPYSLGNIVHHFISRDKTLQEDLASERNAHSVLMKHLIQKRLTPRHWYYGHFHASYKDKYEGIKYRALKELEIYLHI